jgi:hypothetical protein
MEGITLRTSPCTASPDDTLAWMRALYLLPKGFVVTNGIKVMFIESATSVMVETIVRGCFAEVALDGGNA